ncbi:unnamed protein product [Protopolystoma xenopodis]|uniref:Uncharacterized protein n=1 Tax=Protopolystoma xenopodis TaxID=117903 RepID=A0A3S4ZUQ0_9PLAT|nr:unnamed protein product [Protopolystoma xenopodis]
MTGSRARKKSFVPQLQTNDTVDAGTEAPFVFDMLLGRLCRLVGMRSETGSNVGHIECEIPTNEADRDSRASDGAGKHGLSHFTSFKCALSRHHPSRGKLRGVMSVTCRDMEMRWRQVIG